MNLEHELKDALRRVPPPDGFAERVMQQIDVGRASARLNDRGAEVGLTHSRAEARPTWRRYAAAAMLLVAIGGGTTARYIEQRREGARAKQQLLLALRITSEKLRDTRQHVRAIER